MTQLLKRLALKLIWLYQHYLSPLTPPSCRFYPTCSHYTYEAIERFGLWRGGWLGLCRLCKCHPFHRGGIDPVPQTRGGIEAKQPVAEHDKAEHDKNDE